MRLASVGCAVSTSSTCTRAQRRRDLVGREASIPQLLERLSPQRLQRRRAVRAPRWSAAAGWRRSAPPGSAGGTRSSRPSTTVQVESDPARPGSVVSARHGSWRASACSPCFVQDFGQAVHHEREIALDLLWIENQNRRQDHAEAAWADATSMPREFRTWASLSRPFCNILVVLCDPILTRTLQIANEKEPRTRAKLEDDETRRSTMKRIGILTAGGDTPALNAAIHGAVVRANQLRIEIYGLIKGFNCLFNPRVPHVHLNPLFQEIPELDPTKGGTLIGSSRDYIDPDQESRPRSHLRAPLEARHRRAHCDRRRRHAQRAAAAGRTLADRARAQDDRQRSGIELSERTGRVGARQGTRHQHDHQLHAHAVKRRLRSQSHRQLRHARLRHGGPGHGAGRRAHPDDGGEPSAHRDHRGDGTPFGLHRARNGVRTA